MRLLDNFLLSYLLKHAKDGKKNTKVAKMGNEYCQVLVLITEGIFHQKKSGQT